MKNWNFEATFRRLLDNFEKVVRSDQVEWRWAQWKVQRKKVALAQEKVILMFRHHDILVRKLREALQKIETQTMDPPVQEIARKALALK